MYNKTEDLIGCTVEEAQFVLDSYNVPHRIVQVDGESNIVSSDIIDNRYNLYVENDKVVDVTMG